jgi:hypothetical protein
VALRGAVSPRSRQLARQRDCASGATDTGHDEGQLESYDYAEFAKLERAYGNTLDERLRQAGRMVEGLEQKQPGLKNLLKSKGIGDNAMIASLLIQQAERYWARRR